MHLEIIQLHFLLKHRKLHEAQNHILKFRNHQYKMALYVSVRMSSFLFHNQPNRLEILCIFGTSRTIAKQLESCNVIQGKHKFGTWILSPPFLVCLQETLNSRKIQIQNNSLSQPDFLDHQINLKFEMGFQ